MSGEAWTILAILGGYLLGSIPFGVLLTRASGRGDVRRIGSGNIGATNVLRTGSKALAAATLVLDGGKGAAAYALASAISREAALFAGAAAFFGHLYPLYLSFRGGKGVATFLGLMLAAAWPAGLACCATWLIVAAIWRFSSLAALTSAALAPIYALTLNAADAALLALVLAIAIFFKHRGNIARLMKGEEPKIGGAKAENTRE